jgi:hypothetical protein
LADRGLQLLLPLGSRGTFRGDEYQVKGALPRKDGTGTWTEYLLQGPLGYRWLVYDTGHWSFGVPVEDASELVIESGVRHQGRDYRRFRSGTAHVVDVFGQFYWDVRKNNYSYYEDYISPPFMLTREREGKETVWTHLEYVEPAEIDAAFGISTPPRHWICANQANPAGVRLRQILPFFLIACAVMAGIQTVTALRARQVAFPRVVYEFGGSAEQVFGPYTFTAPRSLNELAAGAGLSNSWAELDCVLVNAGTGATFQFVEQLSHYSGIDSDGSWSEGSGQDMATLGAIPGGTYNLVVEGYGADQFNQRLTQPVTLELRHDVVPWSNFWIALLAIVFYPAWLLYRRREAEKERMESATL